MSVVWCLAWGVAAALSLLLFWRFHMPRLTRAAEPKVASKDDTDTNSETAAETKVQAEELPLAEDETETDESTHTHSADSDTAGGTRHKSLRSAEPIIVAVCCAAAACLCGVRVYQTADSVLSIIKMLLGFCVLECAAYADYKLTRIPNAHVLALLAGRALILIPELIFTYEGVWQRLISSVAGGFLCLLLLLIVSRVSHGGIGFGDVKLFAGLGFLCGFYAAIYTLVFSCFLCAVVSVGFLIAKKKGMKDSMPMGPFVLFGYAAVLLLAFY